MSASVEVRTQRLFLAALAGFLILFLNLVRMQVVMHPRYRELSEKNRIRVIYLEGPRGRILDRQGRVLATSRLSFNCTAVPREASKRIDESTRILSEILGAPQDKLWGKFEEGRARSASNTVPVAEDIPPDKAMAIEEKLELMPGFLIETRPRRQYPYADAASHVIGYIGPLSEEESAWREVYGYGPADWVGHEGVEKAQEEFLRGYSGGLQIEVNSRGRLVRSLGVKEPKEGKDIQLTVDAELQSFVQGLLKDRRGAVVVMELAEGGILSMNSSPSYDDNPFASPSGRKHVGPYLTAEGSPMVNRAIRGQYPCGSIYKIVTAVAAMQKRRFPADRSVNCPGYLIIGGKRFGCWKETGHGPQSMAQAFAHSCNVYFYTLGLSAGADALFQASRDFGFGVKTGIDLPSERKGFLPSREWKRSRFHEGWYDGETANLSIGQGYLETTPIQALGMIAATALNGQWLKPHVVERIHGVKVSERQARFLSGEPSQWRSIKRGLSEVVQSPTGTGRLSRVEGLSVAGKTGTAQSGQDKTHAWFVGYTPSDKPKFAIVVFIENGGRGGVAAASVASQVFGWLKKAAYV